MKLSNIHEDIKDEKKDAVKYATNAKIDTKHARPFKRLSKEEIGHKETLKKILADRSKK